LRRSWLIMCRKLSEGNRVSILFEAAYRFDIFHSVCHRAFIAFFSCCLVAEMLTGSGPRLRNVGRSFELLESPDAADFAASSARSFPSMSSWPGVHINLTLHFCFSLHSFHPRLPLSSRVLPVPFLYPSTRSFLFLACVTVVPLAGLMCLSINESTRCVLTCEEEDT